MGRVIIHHAGKFAEWSSVVDAPTTNPMTREEFEAYYVKKYGTSSQNQMAERLDRAELNGSSCLEGTSFEDVVFCNRAGPEESDLSVEQLQKWMETAT